jgi:hypothetical protein
MRKMRRRLINLLGLAIILGIAALGVYASTILEPFAADDCLSEYILPLPEETAIELAESHGYVESDITEYSWGLSQGQLFILTAYTDGQRDGHAVCMSGDPNDPLPVILHDQE